MDRERFDALSRRLAEALPRRGVARVGATIVAATIGATGALGPGLAVDAGKRPRKRKRKKRRRKKRPCGGRCSGNAPQCCPATTQDPRGFCTAADDVCCTSDEGGGACPAALPTCCPPTTQVPDGLCGGSGVTCCPSEKGGSLCPPGFACCATSDDCAQDETCDQHCCLPHGGAQSRGAPRHENPHSNLGSRRAS